MLILEVPTINDNLAGFDQLFKLWDQVDHDFLEVTFSFSRCGFLRQNAVAFLGGLARMIEQRSGAVTFAWDTLRENIHTNLAQNGFLTAFGVGGGPWPGNSIPYREDFRQEKTALMDYLKTKWLGRGWVRISQPLRDAIVGKAWEIYANAFEHAQTTGGIFSCGQHYPKIGELKLTVVDFGVGIPSNVRLYMENPHIAADRALKWAFQRGTTTNPSGSGRGLGLDLLKEFVKINRGHLEVFSHDGYAFIDDHKETYLTRQSFFKGTLVNITFKCDESSYRLASERI